MTTVNTRLQKRILPTVIQRWFTTRTVIIQKSKKQIKIRTCQTTIRTHLRSTIRTTIQRRITTTRYITLKTQYKKLIYTMTKTHTKTVYKKIVTQKIMLMKQTRHHLIFKTHNKMQQWFFVTMMNNRIQQSFKRTKRIFELRLENINQQRNKIFMYMQK